MNPSQYLYQDDEKDRCYLLIHKCTLPGQNANLFLVGDVFLRNFYSVYDFEKDQLALGVNIHAQGDVRMYRATDRWSHQQRSIDEVNTLGVSQQLLYKLN